MVAAGASIGGVRDFTVMLKNLPTDDYLCADENIFRVRLWDKFEKLLQKQGDTSQIDLSSTKYGL